MIQRIRHALQQGDENRFLIFYGNGVEDRFLMDDFSEVPIEEALLHELKEAGFSSIAFISPNKPLFFLDEQSRLMIQPNSAQSKIQAKDPETMMFLEGGPLNLKMITGNRFNTSQSFTYDSMGDSFSIRMLDVLMRREDGNRHAVVFLQAEATLNYFDNARLLAGLVGDWSRLPIRNRNQAIFVFSADNYQHLVEISNRLPVPEIRNAILRRQTNNRSGGGLILIGGPEKDEIDRLVDWHSRLHSLATDEHLDQIKRWMAAEGLELRSWMSRLESVQDLTKPTVMNCGWFPATRIHSGGARRQLEQMIGLSNVKRRLAELQAWIQVRAETQTDSEPLLHMIFTGAPGTGKTTVARLFGEILFEMGVLPRGHLVDVQANDLVADHVGGSAIRTSMVLDSAMGGVLFIDEAYMLTEAGRGNFGQEAVDTLLKRMEDDRGRFVVIAAGYPEKMRLFRKSNPGLARRFPEENILHFEDYSAAELGLILDDLLKQRKLVAAKETRQKLEEILSGMVEHRDEQFGNAGEVRNLVDALERARALRIVHNHLPLNEPICDEDIPDRYQSFLLPVEEALNDLDADLKNLVGVQEFKEYLNGLRYRIQLEQIQKKMFAEYRPQFPRQHLIFTGNPGTGKTTAARLVGQMYRALGLLRKGHVVEVSRSDLVAGYIGQTALRTQARIEEALDGVLFIDEAYALAGGGENDFGQEAVAVLIKAMSDYRERLVVIAAGYPREMDSFINLNPGLASRFAATIRFHDFTRDELRQIMADLAWKHGEILPDEVMEEALDILEMQRKKDPLGFGNARAAESLYEHMKTNMAARVVKAFKMYSDTVEPYSFRLEFSPADVRGIQLENLISDPIVEFSEIQAKNRKRSNFKGFRVR